MKYIKLFEKFTKEYQNKIDLKDFKKIKKGSMIQYMGGAVEVVDNNGYVLKLKDDDGKIFTVNKSQFDHGGRISEVSDGKKKKKKKEFHPDMMYEAKAKKVISDLYKMDAQIDYLSDADDATKNIWKKAGVNPNDDNQIILYSYVNSWPETKKLLDKSRIKYKELEDPNSAGESFIVFNVNESVNELKRTLVSGTMSGSTESLEDRKYELKKDAKGATIGNFSNVTLPKGTIIYNLPGGVFADHFSLKNKYASRSSQGPKYFDKPTFKGIMIKQTPAVLSYIEKNSKVLESIELEEAAKPYKKGQRVDYQLDHKGGVGKFADAVSKSKNIESGVIKKRTKGFGGTFKYELTNGLELYGSEIVGLTEAVNEASDQQRLTHLRKFGIAPNNQPQNGAYIKQVSKPGKFFVDWKDAFDLGDVALEFVKSVGSISEFDIIDLKTMKRTGKQLDVKKGQLGNLRTTYGVRVNESVELDEAAKPYKKGQRVDYQLDHKGGVGKFADAMSKSKNIESGVIKKRIKGFGGTFKYELTNGLELYGSEIVGLTESSSKDGGDKSNGNSHHDDHQEKSIAQHWKDTYGEEFHSKYPAIAKIIKQRNIKDKRELSRIWQDTYGEDFEEQYPALFNKLD